LELGTCKDFCTGLSIRGYIFFIFDGYFPQPYSQRGDLKLSIGLSRENRLK
jgi:hypothetical protein